MTSPENKLADGMTYSQRKINMSLSFLQNLTKINFFG